MPTTTTATITTTQRFGGGYDGDPSYSDDFLLNFHNQAQDEKQGVTNSMTVFNEDLQKEAEQQRILEWQDSFQRNGLADFTPPMSDGLNCLMVGEGVSTGASNMGNTNANENQMEDKLPWEDEYGQASITSLRVLNDDDSLTTTTTTTTTINKNTEDQIVEGGDLIAIENDNEGSTNEALFYTGRQDDGSALPPLPVVRTEQVFRTPNQCTTTNSGLKHSDPTKPAAVYDCIVDQGLMDSVLAMINHNDKSSNSNEEQRQETVRELLMEAATAIREHGIYVLVTQSLSSEMESLLESYSHEAGMEWQFRLDGLSSDKEVVSVARRFNTGAMPKIGKLSRYQP